MPAEALILSGGCFVAAFCAGMAGFAFNLVAAGILFHVLSPQVTAPVLVLGSLLVQSISLPLVWPYIEWRRLAPFVLAGLLGTPLGVWLLGAASGSAIADGIGILLVLYAGWMLARIALRLAPPSFSAPAGADGAVGFASGVLGGVGGFSGALPAIWTDAQGWPKQQARALMQPFIVIMQAVAGIGLAAGGFFTRDSAVMLLIALPALLLGTFLGLRAYALLPQQGFRVVLLTLLLISGLSLLA